METTKFKRFLNSSKRFFVWGLCSLAFVTSLKTFASGADDDCDDMRCDSFFAPEVIQNPEESPFFRSANTAYYQHSDESADRQGEIQRVNLQEWSTFFDWKVEDSQLSYLIYKMTIADLENLTKAMNGQNVPLSAQAKQLKKSFDEVGDNAKVLASLKYLNYAKEVEPLANMRIDDASWEEGTVNGLSKEELALKAKALAEKSAALVKETENKFLSNRYKLQTIRLYYYSAKYAEAQKYYTDNLASFDGEDSAKYRFMDFAAGSLYRDKKYGKANYIYSLIYDNFAPMKRTSYFSFHPMEDADWQETLSLAKTTREEEVLWQILGIYADGKTAIEKIYALNPTSKLLPLLLVREVNLAEESWTTNQERLRHPEDPVVDGVKNDVDAVGTQRLTTLKAITDAGKTYKPYLWQLSLGHLYALAGDLVNADKYLKLAQLAIPRDLILKAQVRMSLLLSRIRGLNAVDAGLENTLAIELTWLGSYQNESNYRATTLNVWVLAKLSRLYKEKTDELRALMLTDTASSDFYRDNAKLDTMINFISKPVSAFDKFLAQNSSYSVGQLNELKALNLLYKGDLSSAVAGFKLVTSEVATQELNADPFMAHIKDDHDQDFETPHTKYTKVTFANKMLSLSRQAQGQGQAAAQASFDLASGYYNMSYYGNGRDIYDTEFGNLRARYDDTAMNKELSRNMDLSQKFYLQAAAKSDDREFKAKAYFMAAKTERNTYYNVHAADQADENVPHSDIHPGVYYKLIRDKFSDTEYFNEIIRECGYFKTYLEVHPN